MTPIRFKGGEFPFINWIRKQTGDSASLIVGPGDDACVIDVANDTSVSLTTDMLLEGTHFDLDEVTAEEVGWKSIGVSLSDVAAMGMVPRVCVAAVGLPESRGREFAEGLHRGMKDLADRFAVPIAGGDVTSWRESRVVICVTALGSPGGSPPVLRSGAKPGDSIIVTGELGGSLLGRHVRFLPRVDEALVIAREFKAHAMIDISDGLSSDLGHVAEESGVGAVIDAEAIPVSQDAREASKRDGHSPLEHALNDGEDFELLFTMTTADAERLVERRPFDTKLTIIGSIVEGDDLMIRGRDGSERPLETGGYEHLRGE